MFRHLCLIVIGTIALHAQPRLSVRSKSSSEIELSWPQSEAGFALEQSGSLAGDAFWVPVPQVPAVDAGTFVVGLKTLAISQFFRLAQGELTGVESTSPFDGEADVAVTRETEIQFSAPLEVGAVLDNNAFYAMAAGRRILSRTELSPDRKKATLFYLEPLPGSSSVDVFLDRSDLLDEFGRPLDPASFGEDGRVVSFNTLSLTPLVRTAVIGTVYSSEIAPGGTNRPLEGVTVTVDGMEQTLRAVTDSSGNFKLSPVPPGKFFVHIDGRTVVDNAKGIHYPDKSYYPFVGKAWEALAGREDNLAGGSGRVYLPLIIAGTLQTVSATNATTISFPPSLVATNPALVGVTITVPPNSLFSDSGARGGKVGIAPVPPDRLPGPLPPGLEMPIVITVQTDGPQNLDQPAPVCFPNVVDPILGQPLPPGSKQALMSFNHDKGAWEAVGSMTVSPDGKLVCSDPGSGILQPGWHGVGPQPKGPPPPPCDGNGPSGAALSNEPQNIHALQTEEECRKKCDEQNDACRFNANLTMFQRLAACRKGWAPDRCPANTIEGIKGAFDTDLKMCSYFAQVCKLNCVPVPPPPKPPKPPRPPRKPKSCRPRSGAASAFGANFPAQVAAMQGSPEIIQQLDNIASEVEALIAPFIGSPNPVPPAIESQVEALFDTADGIAGGNAAEYYVEYQRAREIEQASAGTLGEPDGNAPDYGVLYSAEIVRPHSVMFLRGVTEPFGQYKLFVPRDGEIVSVRFYDPLTRSYAVVTPRLRSDAPWALPSFELQPLREDAPDSDKDGLPDAVELVYGTDTTNPDSDGDGMPDGVEADRGSNPLDGRLAQLGVIATVKTPGAAIDVSVDNGVVLTAEGISGFSVLSTYNGANPVLLAHQTTGGDVRRVGLAGSLALLAQGDRGFSVFDFSNPAAVLELYTVPIAGAQAITTDGSTVYVGSSDGWIRAIDLAGGYRSGDLFLTNGVRDLQWSQGALFALTDSDLLSIAAEGTLSVRGSVNSPAQRGLDNRRIFVGDGVAYATHAKGFNVFDVGNPAQLRLLAAGTSTQFGWRQLVSNGSGLGLAGVGPNSPDLEVRNVSLYDLLNRTNTSAFITELATPGQAQAIALYDGFAYVADGTAGLQVLNYIEFDNKKLAPTVALVLPQGLSPVSKGSVLAVAAQSSDDVQVRSVELYANDVKLFSDSSFPFEFRVITPSGPADSSLRLRARAIDTGGNAAWSDEMVIALAPDVTRPVVRGTTPTGGGARALGEIRAFFSEALAPATVATASFQLVSLGLDGILGTPDDAVVSNTTASYDTVARAAVLNFPSLPFGKYEAVLTPDITDLAGNALDSAYKWEFEIADAAFWSSFSSGLWSEPANWADRAIPKPGDRVKINFPVTIDVTSGTTISQRISGAAGASLALDGTATFDSATFDIDVLFRGNAKATVKNGLTINRKLTMLGNLNLTQLNFDGLQTFGGTGEVLMTDPNFNTIQVQPTSGTLTIGPGLTIRGSGRVGAPGLPLINQGTIISDIGGYSRVTVSGSSVVNEGLLRSEAGLLVPEHFQNNGKVELINGFLNLNEVYTPTQIGQVTGENGTVNFAGTLNTEGQTFAIADSITWNVIGGKIVGGTVSTKAGGKLVVTGPAAFDHLRVDGDMRVTLGAKLRVLNGLTLNGTAAIESNLNITQVTFEGAQTLGGPGVVQFTDIANPITTVIVPTGGALTIGSEMTIRGGVGTLGSPSVPLINDGKIVADGRESRIVIYGNPFTDNGTVQEFNGGKVTVNP